MSSFPFSAYKTVASGAMRSAAATDRGQVLAGLTMSDGLARANAGTNLTPDEARAWAADLNAAAYVAERVALEDELDHVLGMSAGAPFGPPHP